jgi:hypothetical protein
VQRRHSQVVQNRICIEIGQMAFERSARKIDVFTKIYIEEEQIEGANMTKPRGNLLEIILGLGLKAFYVKADPFQLYKIVFALELVKWLLNCNLLKLMFFQNFI